MASDFYNEQDRLGMYQQEMIHLRTRIAELEARLARVAEGWEWVTADFLNFTHVGGYVLFQIGEPEMAVASKFFRDPSEENWKRLQAATDEAPDEGPLEMQSRAVEEYAERIAKLEAEASRLNAAIERWKQEEAQWKAEEKRLKDHAEAMAVELTSRYEHSAALEAYRRDYPKEAL